MSDNNVQITSKGIKNSLKKYTSLKSICEYVWNGFDAKATQVIVEASENILGKLSNSVKPQENVYGLCFGEEKVLLTFNNNTTFLQVNGKTTNGGFAPPTGKVVVTNYKITYEAKKAKSSFTKSLDDLQRVEVGGPGTWTTHITFVFSGGVKVLITPDVAGTQGVYVGMLKEELKMPNR